MDHDVLDVLQELGCFSGIPEPDLVDDTTGDETDTPDDFHDLWIDLGGEG